MTISKITYAALLTGIFSITQAQDGRVGINTQNPSSTLDIRGRSEVTDITGLQAPRLTRAQLTAKGDTLYGSEQQGAIIFITDISGGNTLSQRANITGKGYYFFDGNLWQELTSGGWKTKGNAGTNSATDFIGTTDSADLVFKTGGNRSGLISTGSQNTSFGWMSLQSAGSLNTNITGNAAFGMGGLASLQTGTANTAIGTGSMYSSFYNASYNTALGSGTLAILNNGSYNTALGYQAGVSLNGGSYNTFIGYNTAPSNSTANNTINIANSIYGINAGIAPGETNSSIGINIVEPKSTLDINGSLSYNVGEISSSQTNVQQQDTYKRSVTIIGNSTITLPNPVSCTGRIYNIVYGSGSVNITNTLIDAGISVTGYSLNSNPGSKRVTVQAQGTSWIIIASS
ncbi:hypothetical protein [uncultured Chryseobacterium sp.]|uniref:hypothetical protein n=1 Tax=uncultured Chryseobacterium sp. TaxID=259322 RepID=UPI0025F0BDCE|nr:hypothetical protein [uncultured Chryseobacterium sp.]